MDSSEFGQLLYAALNDNHLDLLREYLNKGKDPNCKAAYYHPVLSKDTMLNNTLIQLAVYSKENNPGAIRELINAGADVYVANSAGYTSLHFAVLRRKRDVVNILLEAGADLTINAQTCNGETALHFAICNEEAFFPYDMSIVNKLLQQEDININITDNKLSSPLLLAIQINSLEIVELLLSKGANPNLGKDFYGGSCLHAAISQPVTNHCIILQLIWKGADIYDENGYGYTPMDILILNVRNDQQLRFAMRCFKVIVLRCEVRDDLILKLHALPKLLNFVNKCQEEFERMKNDNISGNFTLYHFITDEFEEKHCFGRILQVYKSVIEKLVRGFYIEYFYDIFDRINDNNLRVISETIICPGVIMKEIKKEHYPKLVAKIDLGVCKFLSRLDIFYLIVAFSNVRISEALLQLQKQDFSEL